MAARGVSVLKFVGTVSLGGLSYTLTSLTIPALLTLPSAGTAARAFDILTTTASRHARALATASASTFVLAYCLSPRSLRHPYLLYASVLALGSHFATTDLLAPYLLELGPAHPASASPAATARERQRERERRERERQRAAARARMEASYEYLGAGSDAHSEGSAAEEYEAEEEVEVNGEQVRAEVEVFLKKQLVRTALSGLGFFLTVVGIWGDGVVPAYGQAVIIEV
ncbi:hypothetical protein B0I37DRAFT_412829 [Chaetomium sp. MPI-CAGE-AT-0009]|nr:hypothetical protein B0I37DRAFT_412829 [Chaetomium sp. MPI-CAGE-AT-0009]